MAHKLFITPGQEIIQMNEIVYKIQMENIEMSDRSIGHDMPKSITLSAFQSLALSYGGNIAERVRELAKEYGINEFHSFFDGIRCEACVHALIGYARGPSKCKYEPKVEQIRVFFTEKPSWLVSKKIKFFMAADLSCAAYDAFYVALKEKGYLEQFKVDVKPFKDVPSITEVVKNPKLEKEAIETYERLRSIS